MFNNRQALLRAEFFLFFTVNLLDRRKTRVVDHVVTLLARRTTGLTNKVNADCTAGFNSRRRTGCGFVDDALRATGRLPWTTPESCPPRTPSPTSSTASHYFNSDTRNRRYKVRLCERSEPQSEPFVGQARFEALLCLWKLLFDFARFCALPDFSSAHFRVYPPLLQRRSLKAAAILAISGVSAQCKPERMPQPYGWLRP